jgi:hypothetical protein
MAVHVGVFASDMIPHHWEFLDTRISLDSQRMLTVGSLNLRRTGMPEQLTAAFTEELHLLADYLDFNIAARGICIEAPPPQLLATDIGLAAYRAKLHVQALVQAILSLPTLDNLSRRHGGPGYAGPPPQPPPGLRLTLDDLCVSLVDAPLEAWLQQVAALWETERAERSRREAMLSVRQRTQRRLSRGASSDEAGGENPWVDIAQQSASHYIAALQRLRKELAQAAASLDPDVDPLKRAAMLLVKIKVWRWKPGRNGGGLTFTPSVFVRSAWR